METQIKKGNIVRFDGSGREVLALSDSSWARKGIAFLCILTKDLALLKAGNPKGRSCATATVRNGAFSITGKGSKKDVDLALDVREEIITINQDIKQKNFDTHKYSMARRQYFVTLENGQEAFAGDKVMVKFKNGDFEGTIRQVGGNKSGEIMIMFGRRPRAKGISPKYILKIIK
jgi:hypothetical protein